MSSGPSSITGVRGFTSHVLGHFTGWGWLWRMRYNYWESSSPALKADFDAPKQKIQHISSFALVAYPLSSSSLSPYLHPPLLPPCVPATLRVIYYFKPGVGPWAIVCASWKGST